MGTFRVPESVRFGWVISGALLVLGGLGQAGAQDRRAFVEPGGNSAARPAKVGTFRVAADGTGDYASVAAALKDVPAEGGLVLVAPGVYRERVWVQQNHVQLKSANPDPAKTVIVFDLSQGTMGPHPDPPGMATVRVTGDDFLAENITFENDFNRTHEQVFAGSQAQALYLGGDRNVLRNVRILGNQDTLYLGAKGCGQSNGGSCAAARSYFSKCVVAGNVDFIYGDGKAVFEDCEIHSTEHAGGGYLTAQAKHSPEQDSGFVFDRCRLTAAGGVANVSLGRPWRDYATVVFLRTEMGAHIAEAGWREWHPGETHLLATALYGEYGSTGPGAGGRKSMTAEEAAKFEPRVWLRGADGWDPLGR